MGARRNPGGDCWLPAARVLVSGEEWFVQVSSRIVLSVCRLIVAAVLWFWWLGDGDACAAREESQRRGGTKTLTKRHQPNPLPLDSAIAARFRPLGVGGAILTQPSTALDAECGECKKWGESGMVLIGVCRHFLQRSKTAAGEPGGPCHPPPTTLGPSSAGAGSRTHIPKTSDCYPPKLSR